MPLWGTCLGFELLASAASGSDSVLSHVAALDVSLTLVLAPLCRVQGKGVDVCRLLGPGTPRSVLQHMTSDTPGIIYHNHRKGVRTEAFNADAKLQAFARVVATSRDERGVEFVSAFEALRYPIYAVCHCQW